MNRPRNTYLDVFIQCKHKGTISRKRYGAVCLRNIQNSKNSMIYYTVEWPDLGTLNWVFLDNIKIQKKEKCEAESFSKTLKFQKFQLSSFTLTWTNEGKMNSVLPDMTYSK